MILVVPSADPARHGGIERVTRQVIEAASRRGLGEGASGGPDWQPLEIWSANDAEASVPGATVRAFGGAYLKMMLAAAFGKLPAAPGPILCMHAGLSPVARLLARRLRCPYDVFFHGIEVWRRLRLRTKWGVSRARKFLSNSAFTLARFEDAHPDVRGAERVVVPLGLSDELERAAEAVPASLSPQEAFVLTVSRLSLEDDYKGHLVLFDAMLRLRREHPEARLVVAGDGDARESLQTWAAERDPEAVHFAGRVTDAELLWLYRRCRLFALLSEGEGFGLVFLEAMSEGKPCVCTNADASAEVVVDRETGFAVPPRNSEAAAAAIRNLWVHSDLASRLGNQGRERVRREFLSGHFIDRLARALASP